MAGGSVDEPGGPTFLGMQPSEIAAILGVDDANPTLFKRLEELDGLYRNGQLKGSAVKERADLSKVLRDAYRQRNDGRAPVWVLPPGYRETWATKMEARVAAMRQAGWSEEQITSALPDYKLANPAVPSAQRTASTTKPPVSHTTSEYLGQERWKRVMALEKIASDPSVDSTTRYTARNGLFTELGVPFPKGDKVPELVRRSMQERMLMAGPSGAGRTSPAPAAGLQLAMDGFAAEPGSRVQSASRKAWQTAVDIAGLPRTLISSIDMGGIARQGGILGVSYPREWREAIAAQFKALRSEAGAEALAKARQADGYFQVLKANGLYESPWGNTLADLSAREENFMSTLASKIPGIRASERSYAEGLNQQRWLTGAHILADWEADAGSLAAIPRQRIEALTKLLNVASGRGEIPAALRAPVFNNLLFSPRFLASRFELIGMAMNGGGSPEVRRIAQKMLARYLGTGVAILTMASAAGIGGTSLDPNSSDFGKLKIGNTRYDMWGGYQPIFRYMANFATGKSSSGQPQDRLTTLGKFARTKLAPVPGDVVNILKGETMLGEELSPSAGTARDIFIQNTVPLFLQDAAQAFLDEGFVGVVKTAPGFVGLGTQTYIPRTQQLDEKAKALAAGNPTAYPDGVKGFFDLQPKDRDAIKQADPRLWQEYVAEGSDQLKRSEGLRAELETKQQSLDDQLLAGALPVEEWEKGYRALRDELRYRRKEIYGDKPMTQDDIKTPLDAFYFTLQQVDDGVLTQQQADDWKAKLPAEDQKYIDDNTGLGGTALVRLYKSVQAKYYSIPRYLGYTADEGDQMSQLATYARESAGGNQQRALSLVTRYGAGMPARVLSGARRIIMGGTMAPRVNPARSTFRASNPGAVLLGGGYLDGTTVSKLKVALGSSRAA